MRMKRLVVGLVAVAAPVAAVAASPASAGQEDAATGGGQVLVGTTGGAGDTIAFTAKGTVDAGDGQVQYVDRTGGTGQDQIVYHGTVSCLSVSGNVAEIAGTWTDGGTFGIYVEDNGEGKDASDVVTVLPGESSCDFEAPGDNDKVALARGNAQVRDN